MADNTVSNYISFDFFDPQCSQFCKARVTHKARGVRESQGRMHVTFDPTTSVHIATQASSIAFNYLAEYRKDKGS